MSSYRVKRSFSRNTIRHQVLTRQDNELETHFSNQMIAWTKKPGIQIVDPKPKEAKKFLNLKAYETIPLLSGFRRYMSVDVLHGCKSNKYEVIMKKETGKKRDKMLFENAQLRQYSLKFNPQTQDSKIHSSTNLRSKMRLHEHTRVLSQIMEQKRLPGQKRLNLLEERRLKSIMSEILQKKQQGLSIEGSKIQCENSQRMSRNPSLNLISKECQAGSKFYQTFGTQIKIEDQNW